ncbi:hypothetical protein NITGR_170031 [Nitrospina gracilis 3/211]|uniref:Uncharacterized protein n=1 Tax=Nitrospina gracilis (strain 3/211) TaxID=1266370 RepID=M1YH45_NITG3|nr:hypothetical protein NITGR_170031 [Nitrospina gracilis 3/211]
MLAFLYGHEACFHFPIHILLKGEDYGRTYGGHHLKEQEGEPPALRRESSLQRPLLLCA